MQEWLMIEISMPRWVGIWIMIVLATACLIIWKPIIKRLSPSREETDR